MWTLTVPFGSDGKRIKGAAYDPATSRVFLAMASSEVQGKPLIHQFTVTRGGGTTTPPPTAPTNVHVIR